ncbi:MAG: response regulator transcription factor [Bacteroidales bacterium]|nr:response regulator transcription factor [Bacteroidales bacterium]MCF8345511.1 response regulator transcription factor [Bacteroidales bacterium]MCF8351614.1 response regulator transcription factor [Bacteroidales bacterium]MCF8377531.1 response regulator transcription factor [Bacteroidales bacterium]MCF8401803.1 response regulator transcription factor [Bacteroidales bacterium]
MIKTLIVDDHFLIREGLKKILKTEPNLLIVGELQKGSEVRNFLLKQSCDLIILDINLPDRNGIDVLKDIQSINPDVYVLMLSVFPEEQFALRAIKAGAAGYISKDRASEELIVAIRKVIAGNKYISDELAEKIALDHIWENEKKLHEKLSNREFQILLLLGAGKKVRDIADELSLSVNTVNTYRSRIFEKMNFNSLSDLIRYVVNNNLVG